MREGMERFSERFIQSSCRRIELESILHPLGFQLQSAGLLSQIRVSNTINAEEQGRRLLKSIRL